MTHISLSGCKCTIIEDKIMSDGKIEIVTSGCLMLDDVKQNTGHFNIQYFITKKGVVFVDPNLIWYVHFMMASLFLVP